MYAYVIYCNVLIPFSLCSKKQKQNITKNQKQTNKQNKEKPNK